MATHGTCHHSATIERLLGGTLPQEEESAFATHLEGCPVCRATFEDLAQDLRLAAARKTEGAPFDPETSLKRVMSALEQTRQDTAESSADAPAPATDDLPLDFLSPPDDPQHVGKLDHYEILEVVGRGGLGIVLKGYDTRLKRIVAIKVPLPELAANAVARKRFAREAEAAAAVSHDHVVTIHAVDESGRPPYLVMEYIDGASLQQDLDRHGPLELRRILRIGMQTAQGLAAAHGQGLVHRDIKPANILLENGVQRVKITDFGLARAVDDVGITQSGTVAGTPTYMSPEQARGEPVDHRSDLFSLGCVLYAACTGRPPFRADTALAVLKRVCEDDPTPIAKINPDVPDWLGEIIEKLLAKDPGDRFTSAQEVADLLGQHLAHLQQPGVVPQPARLHQSRCQGWLQRYRERRRWSTDLALAAITVALIATGLVLRDRWNDVRPPASLRGGRPETAVEMQNSLGMLLRLVPAGEFLMGTSAEALPEPASDAVWFFSRWIDERRTAETPQHRVRITRPFYMGAHEVTVGQFRQFVETAGHRPAAEADAKGGFGFVDGEWRRGREFDWQNPGFPQDEDEPVCNVTWEDAVAFCRWLSEKEGDTYRLPTETEWEYACRAGTTTLYHSGDDPATLQGAANIADQSLARAAPAIAWAAAWDDAFPFTAPVGSFQANALGLYDMHGNAWEWCADVYDRDYYRRSPQDDPLHRGEGGDRIFRGGGFDNWAGFVRSADRYGSHSPTLRTDWAGFRVVRELTSDANPSGINQGIAR